MREHVSQSKKATTASFSIPSLKHRIPGFGLDSSQASPQAVPLVQSLHKPLTHDISRMSLHRPQAKLSISQPGDKYEQEADRVAQQVMQRMAQPVNRQSIQPQALPEESELQMKPMANFITPLMQRQEMPEDESELQMKSLDSSTLQRQEVPEDEEELQMKPMVQRRAEARMAAAPDLEASINQARGGGQAMAKNIRHPMEVAFGADFSGVKVHTDGQSDQLNRSIQARAFTTGQDVFFRQGEYNPGSRGGQELLAHELTHVVQQNGGAVQRQIDRIVTPTVIQRFATTYTPDADHAYTGGKGITARVGAQSVKGRIPGGGIPPIINHVGAIKGRYVAGHLMNEEIGGLADNPNLTVLSIQCNNFHKGYERNLKTLAYWAGFIERSDVSLTQKYGDKAYEHGADYKVEVVTPSPDGTATFRAEHLLVSGLKLSITPIRIHKVTRVEEPWPEMSAYKVTDAIVQNVPPYPPAPGTRPPTKVKPQPSYKSDNDDYTDYNKSPSAITTRSNRTSRRPKPY
ncbi:eCIS core domain-containing protein [Nostoc sp.]|uniref:eCIS core domain-containing protein n=1 Tax=Nostoc sp. TaxID=1180 RepID=UPI002FF45CA4